MHHLPNNIEAAAAYLASTPQCDRPTPIVPYLRAIFVLTATEIVTAIRRANELRAGDAP